MIRPTLKRARASRADRRTWPACGLLLALCWAQAGAAAEHGPLRRALVRSDRPESWPAGDWERVPLPELAEFERAYVAGDLHSEPQPQIERAVFRGTLFDDAVLKGELTARIRRLHPHNTFLDLGSVTPSLAGLNWDDGPAVWGVARDRAALLYVDRDQGELHGSWALRGQPLLESLEFELRLPPAASLRLELLLPNDRELRSSHGLVLAPEEAADGLRCWSVELGQTTTCQCTVIPVRNPSARPEVSAEWVTAYTLRSDGCRLQTDFNVLIPTDPPATLEFLIPPELERPQATTVANSSLPAQLDSSSQPARLIVPLPERLSGRLGTIRISGELGLQESKDWRLPEVRLANSAKLSGIRRVHVERPLLLQSVTPHGMRQTDLVSNETGITWTFEDLSADADLAVRVGRPATALTMRAMTLIDWDRDEARFRTAAQLLSQGDRVFHAELPWPAEWGIVDVTTPAAEAGGVTSWHTQESAAGLRLEIEFRQALTSHTPRSIIITGRRIELAGRRLELELFPRLDGAAGSQVLLAVGGEALIPRDLAPFDGARQWQPADGLADWAPLAAVLNATVGDQAHAWFVQTENDQAGRVMATAQAKPDAGTGHPPEAPSIADNGADASPLVLDLSLESELGVPGTAWHRHRAIFRLFGRRPEAPPKIRFPAGLELDLVAVDGRPQNVVTTNETVELLDWPAAPDTVEILYRSPVAASRSWLSRQVETPLPDWGQPPRELEWKLNIPRTERLTKVQAPRSSVTSWAQMGWRQRLFGVLGRDDGPARPASSAARMDGAAEQDESASDRTVVIGALSPGPSLSIQLVDVRNEQRAGWLAVFGGALSVGLVRWLVPRWSRPLWFVCVALCVAAWGLPELPARCCGSLFVGTLIGLLLPRRWLTPPETSAWPWGRRAAMRAGAAAGCGLLLYMGRGDPASAQTPVDSGTATLSAPGALAFDALILQRDATSASEARLQRRLLPAFQAWRRSRRFDPPWLLQSARYTWIDDDSPGLRVELTIAVFDRRPQAPVSLPFARLWVSDPDDCRVDGRPAQIRPTADSRALLIEIPGVTAAQETVRIARVELQLRLSASARTAAGWEFDVPPVLDTQLVLPAAAVPATQLVPRVYRSAGLGDTGQPQFDLGDVNSIAVRPTTATVRAADFSADAVSLIEVHPLHLRIRTQLTPTGTSATGREALQLRLLLPARADVRAVTADGLKAYSVRMLQPDLTVVDLELEHPLSTDAAVSLDYVLPTEASGTGIRIPPLQLVGGNGLRSHRLGLLGAAGVELAPPTAASLSTDLREMPFTGLLTADAAMHADWPVPSYEYIATAPTAIPVAASVVQSVRLAALEQSLLVDTEAIRWQATVEVDIPLAPVFSHEFQLSPEVQLESVSLSQDGKELLQDWARHDDQLVLYFRGGTGRQQIRLAGTLRADPARVTPFPTFRLQDATITASELIVQSSASQRLELFAADGTALPAGPTVPAEAAGAAAFIRRFSQQDAALPASFRGLALPPPLSLTVISSLDRRDGQWQWLTEFWPNRPWDAGEELEIRVPRNLAPQLRPLVHVSISPDGDADETVRLSPSSDPEQLAAVLGFTIPVDVPEQGDWSVPRWEVLNAVVAGDWTVHRPDVPLSPALEAAEIADPTAWPDIVRQRQAGAAGDNQATLYRWLGIDRKFHRSSASNGAPDVRLVETALWRERDGAVAGTSLFWVVAPQPSVELRFSWPTTVELQSACWDNRPLNVRPSSDATLICRRQGQTIGSAHCLRLDWRAAAGTVAPVNGEVWRPQCESTMPRYEVAGIVSPTGTLSLPYPGRGGQTEVLRTRAEALLDVWNAAAKNGDSAVWIAGILGREIDATLGELDAQSPSAHVQLHTRWDQARSAATALLKTPQPNALSASMPLTATLVNDQRAIWEDLTGSSQPIRLWDLHAGLATVAIGVAILLFAVLLVRFRARFRQLALAGSLPADYAGLTLLGLLWCVGLIGGFIGGALLVGAAILEWRMHRQTVGEPLRADI